MAVSVLQLMLSLDFVHIQTLHEYKDCEVLQRTTGRSCACLKNHCVNISCFGGYKYSPFPYYSTENLQSIYCKNIFIFFGHFLNLTEFQMSDFSATMDS